MTHILLGAILAGGPLMCLGLACMIAATLYIMVVSITGWYSRYGDTLMVAIGCFGCLLIVFGMMTLHP